MFGVCTMNLNMKVGIRMEKIISLSQDRKKKKKNRKKAQVLRIENDLP